MVVCVVVIDDLLFCYW